MAKDENKPEDEQEELNIIEEEKAEEKSKEKDYNTIFDDSYTENPENGEGEEVSGPEEKEPVEPVREEEEKVKEKTKISSSSKSSKKKKEDPKGEKSEKAKEKKEDKGDEAALDQPAQKQKKSKGSLAKKIVIGLVILLALFLGALAGYLYFKNANKPSNEVASTTTTTATKPEKSVYVNADGGLKMRKDASANSAVLAVIPNGTKLTVLDERDGWYKVEYNGQTGWVSKDFVSETKPADMKTYTGTGYSVDNPKFSIEYPVDWTLNGYKVSKTDSGKMYTIAFGEGAHGLSEGDTSITSSQSDVTTASGQAGTQTIAKKDGEIITIVTQFTKGNSFINIEFDPPAGYDQSYIDVYNKMVDTFKFL